MGMNGDIVVDEEPSFLDSLIDFSSPSAVRLEPGIVLYSSHILIDESPMTEFGSLGLKGRGTEIV